MKKSLIKKLYNENKVQGRKYLIATFIIKECVHLIVHLCYLLVGMGLLIAGLLIFRKDSFGVIALLFGSLMIYAGIQNLKGIKHGSKYYFKREEEKLV